MTSLQIHCCLNITGKFTSFSYFCINISLTVYFFFSFLFAGLASFMDLQLCQAIRKIRFINRHGLTKMIRNILALQQNLRNIVVIHETSYNLSSSSRANGSENKPTWLQASMDGFGKSTKLWELVGKEPEVRIDYSGCFLTMILLTLYLFKTANVVLDSFRRTNALFR